jgi:hypothetical protein
MISQAKIQEAYAKSGVMTWEDFRAWLGPEYKHTGTTEASAQPLKLTELATFSDDAAAAAAGYTGNELFKLPDGTIAQKEIEVLP